MDQVLIVKQVISQGLLDTQNNLSTILEPPVVYWPSGILFWDKSRWAGGRPKYVFGLVDCQNISVFTGPLCVPVIRGVHVSVLHACQAITAEHSALLSLPEGGDKSLTLQL